MDINLHSTIINCILQDLEDKSYISEVKKHMSNLSSEERETLDVQETITLLSDIVKNNIIEKSEALYEISNKKFSKELRVLLDDTTNFSKRYKRDALAKLSVKSSVSSLEPFIAASQELLNKIELGNGKMAIEALYALYDNITALNKEAAHSKISSDKGERMIVDPIDNEGIETVVPVLKEMKTSNTNKVKIISALNSMLGGGSIPGTFNIFCAIGGEGKSQVMQNIIMYASKNNLVSDFELKPGMKPCLLYVSLELSKKQLFQRHLAWCDVVLTDTEVERMSDEGMKELVKSVNIREGLNIPIIYLDRTKSKFGTTCDDIENEIEELELQGYQSIMVVIDYLDKLNVASLEHKRLNLSGADGSALLRQKGKESRDLAMNKNTAVIGAAQLSGEAQSELGRLEPYYRMLDPLYHANLSMLAGSKLLQTEVEIIIFLKRIEIANKTVVADELVTDDFISAIALKYREGRTNYVFSERDKKNETQYNKYTFAVQNGLLKGLFKETSKPHAVIPLHGFRLDEFDHGKSIRMFYANDHSEMIELADIIRNANYGTPRKNPMPDIERSEDKEKEENRIKLMDM